MNILQNHPQTHHDKHKIYFYKNTIQLKNEYQHLFEPFIPYFNQTDNNINPHYTQFCTLNRQYPQLYLFYASIITLATTPSQCEIVITLNTIQWTNNIIRKLTQLPHPPQTTPNIFQNFRENNLEKLYSFITNYQPNLELLQLTFPYLPESLLTEFLKCLYHIPNFIHPTHIQNPPPITPQQNPRTAITTSIITWNCGSLNTTIPGKQSIINKNPQPAIIAIQETKLTASKSTKYLQRLFPTYKMIFNNTSSQTKHNRIIGQPYHNPRGGLLTLIHQNYTFLGNISKIPTSIDIFVD
jgi:hypothetical protein